jgi:glycosyltransferase involved in cell wall biosynthesis
MHLLERFLRSCLNQTYKNVEIIIVDDFSTDDTPDVAKRLSNEDNRVIYIRNNTHQGLPASRNVGLSQARGEFVFFSEDDLILSHNMIETLVDTYIKLSSKLKIGAVAPRLKLFSSMVSYMPPIYESQRIIGLFNELTGEPYFSYDIPANGVLLAQHLPATGLIPRKVFEEVGTYYTGYKFNYGREESDIYFRMLKKAYVLIYQPKAIAFHMAGSTGGCTISSYLVKYASGLYNHFIFLTRAYGIRAIPMSIVFILKKMLKIKFWNKTQKPVEHITLLEKIGFRLAYWKALNHYLNILRSHHHC